MKSNPIQQLIMDMDGVLWRGDSPMPHLPEFFQTLRDAGIDFVLATNNATKTADQYTQKLAGFGVAVPPEQILTSSEATAAYLATEYEPGTAVYIVGETGLKNALERHDFQVISPAEIRAGAFAPVVVVGLSKHTTYEELAMGAHLVERGARFVGTNPDTSIPTEIGPLPGAGALLAAIEATTGVAPFVIGKPGPVMFAEATKRLGGKKESIAMVGDRLSTDIAGAKNSGLRAILVLSGISTREEAEHGAIAPDFIFDDINAMAEFLVNGQT